MIKTVAPKIKYVLTPPLGVVVMVCTALVGVVSVLVAWVVVVRVCIEVVGCIVVGVSVGEDCRVAVDVGGGVIVVVGVVVGTSRAFNSSMDASMMITSY